MDKEDRDSENITAHVGFKAERQPVRCAVLRDRDGLLEGLVSHLDRWMAASVAGTMAHRPLQLEWFGNVWPHVPPLF